MLWGERLMLASPPADAPEEREGEEKEEELDWDVGKSKAVR